MWRCVSCSCAYLACLLACTLLHACIVHCNALIQLPTLFPCLRKALSISITAFQGEITLPYKVSSADWQELLSRSEVRRLLLVRHPHSRLLSAYLDQVVEKRAVNRFPAGYNPFVGGSALPAGGFDAFVRAVVGAKELEVHFKLQSQQCGIDLGMEYQYLKVEEIDEWYDDIICTLGLQDAARSGWQEPFLPYHGDSPCFHSSRQCGCALNCSQPCNSPGRRLSGRTKRGRTAAPMRVTHADNELKQYYTEELAELVNSWARADLSTFGYDAYKVVAAASAPPTATATAAMKEGPSVAKESESAAAAAATVAELKIPESYQAPQLHMAAICDLDPPIGKLTQFALNNYPVKAESGPPVRNAVLEACAPLHEAKVVLWLGGPPGVGKSTLVRELRQYGFMAMDAEQDWAGWDGKPGDHLSYGRLVTPTGGFKSLVDRAEGRRLMTSPTAKPHTLIQLSKRLEQLEWASKWALRETTAAFAFGACFGEWVARRIPSHVVGVMLLPNHSEYTERWQKRNPDDGQSNERRWQADLEDWTIVERKMKERPDDEKLWVRLMDTKDVCAAGSIANMCTQVMLGLLAQPKLLCFYCKRASRTSRFASYCTVECRRGL